MSEKLRLCYKCKMEKSLEDFFHEKARKYGRSYTCKVCDKKSYKERYNNKLKFSEKYKENMRIQSRKWVKNNKEKARAHSAAYWRKKEIKKDYCERCFAKNVTLHMHHPDYSKPLEVITLCIHCHEGMHHKSLSI